MAAIKGFTEAQNASLARVEVGNLILVDQEVEQSDEENDSNSEGDNESDDGSNEDGDEEEEEDSDDEDSNSESESESGAVTPQAIGAQDSHPVSVGTDHAEHIEDVSRLVAASPDDIIEYRTLRAAKDSDHDDTEEHLITVYLVVKVTKNVKGAIKDLSLVPLKYSSKADVSPGTFQLYGKQCVPSFYTGGTTAQSSQLGKEFISIRDLPGGETLELTVSPEGDLVRSVVLEDECPACDDGWLDCITQLDGMVKDYTIPSSLPNEPTVCPSCIGIELMNEHQDLRAD